MIGDGKKGVITGGVAVGVEINLGEVGEESFKSCHFLLSYAIGGRESAGEMSGVGNVDFSGENMGSVYAIRFRPGYNPIGNTCRDYVDIMTCLQMSTEFIYSIFSFKLIDSPSE